MANIFGARVVVHPSFVEPDLIITTAQPSGFMEGLGGRALRVKLGAADLFVYQTRIDLRHAVNAQQAVHNALPSATIRAEYIQTSTYRVRCRAEYGEFDIEAASQWNVALPAAQRLALRQGHFQYLRTANLYGINASNNEGLLNTVGATVVNLPPDQYGNTTLTTYDNGAIAYWLLGQVNAALQRIYALGTPARLVFIGPQRILGQLQLQNIVEVTSYQRPGAGTATSAQVLKRVAEEFDIDIEFAYDDTLIGQGAGFGGAASGADALLMIIPEAIVPTIEGINTNEFATLSPQERAMTMQYADVAAPVEVTTPIVEGLDVTSQMRISSGWSPRPQAVTILTIPH